MSGWGIVRRVGICVVGKGKRREERRGGGWIGRRRWRGGVWCGGGENMRSGGAVGSE